MAKNEVRMPRSKLDKVLGLVRKWEEKVNASKRELQELLGYLHHVSCAIRPGRLFVSRMLQDLRLSYRVAPHPVSLSEGFMRDLQWWKKCMLGWNGISIFLHDLKENLVQLDASTNGGEGGRPGLGGVNLVDREWYEVTLPLECPNYEIGELELINHIVAARLWGPLWQGLEISGDCDNTGVVSLLGSGKSTSETRLEMARLFCQLQIQHKFLWLPSWIGTKENDLSDAASRWGHASAREHFNTCNIKLKLKQVNVPNAFFNIDQEW